MPYSIVKSEDRGATPERYQAPARSSTAVIVEASGASSFDLETVVGDDVAPLPPRRLGQRPVPSRSPHRGSTSTHLTAVDADQVVVMAGEPLGQLETGQPGVVVLLENAVGIKHG